MRGLVHNAAVYRRLQVGGVAGYEDAPFAIWKCRIDPLSPSIQLREGLAQSTHSGVGEPTPALSKGWKLVVGGNTYRIVHVQEYDAPGALPHHQEVYLTRAE